MKANKAEARRASIALEAEISRDQFLSEWYENSKQAKAGFEDWSRKLDVEARRALAVQNGFRSWARWLEYMSHVHEALHLFATHPTFQSLWAILKREDIKAAIGLYSYGPHNGGVPSKILSAIETWYQSPHLTARERKAHANKISRLCDDLRALLDQVTPGGTAEWRLQSFRLEADQTRRLARKMGTKLGKTINADTFGLEVLGSDALHSAGVTPAWTLRQISDAASAWGRSTLFKLPTKVRARGALKTFLIYELDSILHFFAIEDSQKIVGPQLRADIVALLARCDCDLDDVRKATAQRRLHLANEWKSVSRRQSEDSR